MCRGTDIHGRNASWGHQNPIFPAFQLLVLNMIFCHFFPFFSAHECCHHPTMPLKVIIIITKCCDPNIFQERATRGHYQLIFFCFPLVYSKLSILAIFCSFLHAHERFLDPTTPLTVINVMPGCCGNKIHEKKQHRKVLQASWGLMGPHGAIRTPFFLLSNCCF